MASGGQNSPKAGDPLNKPENSPEDGPNIENVSEASPVHSVPKSLASEKSPNIPGKFPSSPDGPRVQSASTKAPAKFVLQSPPAVIARQAAGQDTASQASESKTEHEPKGQPKEAGAGASSSTQPQDQSAQRPKRTRKAASKAAAKGSPGNVPSKHQNLADELAAASQSDTSSPGAPVSPGEKKEPETQSHGGSLDYVANIPVGSEEKGQNKETGQTQEPSPAGTDASKQTIWLLARSLRPDELYGLKTESPPPRSARKGKQPARSEPAPSQRMDPTQEALWREALWSDVAPVFLMNDPEDEGLGAYQAPDAIREGENMYETIIRDQIRRCKKQLGDRFTEAHADIIRRHYHEHCGINRCPTEYSAPVSIHSPSSLKDEPRSPPPQFVDDGPESPPGTHGDSTYDPLSPRTATTQGHLTYLRERVDRWERLFPDHIPNLLRNACFEIQCLKRRDQDAQKELAALTQDITTLKADLRSLEARGSTTPTTPTAAAARNLPYQGQQQQQRQQPPPVLLQASLFNATAVSAALIAMVWLVTEAMLHSQRLSGGFGPFINGGYNGLASVAVFGTWRQFLWFVGVVVYVGLFAVRSALGW